MKVQTGIILLLAAMAGVVVMETRPVKVVVPAASVAQPCADDDSGDGDDSPQVKSVGAIKVDGAIDGTGMQEVKRYRNGQVCLAEGSWMCWDRLPDVRIQ